MSVAMTRRSRLFRAFKPIIDGLFDKGQAAAEESDAERFERDWYGSGQWLKSHAYSYETEIIERMDGNPLHTLARAVDGVHCREIASVALIAIGTDGVIHTAWSDGDLQLMGEAAKWLGDDMRKASGG